MAAAVWESPREEEIKMWLLCCDSSGCGFERREGEGSGKPSSTWWTQSSQNGQILRHGGRRFGVQPSGCTDRDRSSRAMARTGLRMMPTSPSPPLKFRTAGFPQYGFKVSLSDRAFLENSMV